MVAIVFAVHKLKPALSPFRQKTRANPAIDGADFGVLVIRIADRKLRLLEKGILERMVAAQVIAGLL